MNILAIESSSDQCVLALRARGQFFSSSWGSARTHSAVVLEHIAALLNEAEIQITDLDRLALGCGPGSFTGVRLAVSIIQGLAYAAGISIIPVNSLAVFAQTAYDQYACECVIVAMNARRGEHYVGEFYLDNQKIMKCFGGVDLKSSLPSSLNQTAYTYWVGNGFLKLDGLDSKRTIPHLIPTAQALICLVEAQIGEQECGIDPMGLQANYVLTNLYQPKAE